MTTKTPETTPTNPSEMPGVFGWNELNTRDEGAATAFYTRVFGWGMVSFSESGNLCTLLTIGPCRVGGIVQNPSPEMKNLWVPYVRVASVDATLATALEHGAKVMMPPVDVPKVGRIAVFEDPQGATLGLFQPGSLDDNVKS